jgi:hypothetical protein
MSYALMSVMKITQDNTPIPLLTSPLKGEELNTLPFKGRVGVGMGVNVGYMIKGVPRIYNAPKALQIS